MLSLLADENRRRLRLWPNGLLAGMLFAAFFSPECRAQDTERELRITPQGNLRLAVGSISEMRHADGGVLYGIAKDFRSAWRVFESGEAVEIHLGLAPDLGLGSLNAFQGFAVDQAGQIHIPMVGKMTNREFVCGAFQYTESGSFRRFIRFQSPFEVRRLAIDSNGTILALGLDAAYFRGMAERNFMIRRYAADGRLLGAFSDETPETPDRATPYAKTFLRRVQREADLGDLWLSGGRVFQLMQASARLRVFSAEGTPIEEVRFLDPEPEPAPAATCASMTAAAGIPSPRCTAPRLADLCAPRPFPVRIGRPAPHDVVVEEPRT
ncbi:MAG: hypothetical protein HY235_18875 [Acidobacteria bacterium]|nr:hypothetical protein [Acidobacteriota bacterium]